MQISWTKEARWSTEHARKRRRSALSAGDQTIDDPIKLVEIAALFHHVAVRRVTIHLAIAKAPGVAALRIKPDDLFGALLDFADAPIVRQVVVVARVAEHDHGGALVDRADVIGNEAAERVAEIRMRVHIDNVALEGDVERFLRVVIAEMFGDFADIGDENETAH